jgi:hypothetical protein
MDASEVLLRKAEIIGLRAPVDVVPDPTVEGFDQWKAGLLTYFGCAIDSYLDKNHVPMMTDDMFEAMKHGFARLVLSQPYVEAPLQPMEPTPRQIESQIIDEVFAELKTIPHHCTH